MNPPRKKLINSVDYSVKDSLRGLIFTNDKIKFHDNNPRVVLRSDVNDLKTKGIVSLISGGGSGHEPFAAGYVGKNALTAAVCGDIFASPPSYNVMEAIKAVAGPAGTIVFVINYTGDRLNFGMAVERMKAESENALKIDLIYVDDDIALEQNLASSTGGRGLAGVALLTQIIGNMAENLHYNYELLMEIAPKIIANLGTFGVTLYACALPGQPEMFELAENEMELGLGIHGEPGQERKKIVSAQEICTEILEKLAQSKRLKLKEGERIAVILNNLGSVSQLEMGILQSEICEWLLTRGFIVECFITGTLMTSIDAHGFSISILRLVDDLWLDCLAQPSAISELWKFSRPYAWNVKCPKQVSNSKDVQLELGVKISREIAECIERALKSSCNAIIKAKDELNRLDRLAGDGDCGSSLETAARAIIKAVDAKTLAMLHPKSLFLQLSKIFEESVGGTSGALYALMFGAASNAFTKSVGSEEFKNALKISLDVVQRYGHARPGDRTMVDPLDAAANSKFDNWNEIVEVIEEAAKKTSEMQAKAGRASYTTVERQKEPDPGAIGLAIWIRAVYNEVMLKS